MAFIDFTYYNYFHFVVEYYFTLHYNADAQSIVHVCLDIFKFVILVCGQCHITVGKFNRAMSYPAAAVNAVCLDVWVTSVVTQDTPCSPATALTSSVLSTNVFPQTS